MCCEASAFDTGAEHGQRRTFAIGPCDMDHGGEFVLRVAERVEQLPHAIQREVDDLGMKRHHPLKDDIRSCVHVLASAFVSVASPAFGAGRSPATAGGISMSIRMIWTSSSRIFVRGVTRSSMP